jgi:hypothetical protein
MNPILIGIINALIPGLGYILIRERVVFGVLTLTSAVLLAIVMFTDPSSAFAATLLAESPAGRALEGISYALGMFAFAYDAYDLARTKRNSSSVSTSN